MLGNGQLLLDWHLMPAWTLFTLSQILLATVDSTALCRALLISLLSNWVRDRAIAFRQLMRIPSCSMSSFCLLMGERGC